MSMHYEIERMGYEVITIWPGSLDGAKRSVGRRFHTEQNVRLVRIDQRCGERLLESVRIAGKWTDIHGMSQVRAD